MIKKMAFGIMIIIEFSSCSGPSKLTDMQARDIKTDVSKMLGDNFKKIKEEGYIAELDFLDSSSRFFWIPPGQAKPFSYKGVAAIVRKFVPGNRSVENTWDTLHVQPLSKNFASYTGRYHAKYVDTAGRVSTYNMLDVGVVIKRKDGWKIISGQTTSLGTK